MTKPSIGFIGLGLMGAAMANRLLDKEYSLRVLGNRSRAAIDAAVARGAVEAEHGRAIAEASDIVMLCMDTSASVESRMLGDDGVIAGLGPGTVVIDFGTSLPDSTKRLGALAAERGATMLDAPLGRTPEHAKDGLLNIMAAGDKAAFDRVQPVLLDLGENVFHLGPLGAGHTIKLINNFFGMTTACAMSEAFAMADKAGVDRRTLYNVMSAGPLHSPMMDLVAAYGLEGEGEKLAFSVRNAGKDLGYYGRMASDLGFSSPMSPCARNTLSEATEKGFGDHFVSQLVDFMTAASKDGR